jgi:pimeloyl-ACP methyl ester carboxylesterase
VTWAAISSVQRWPAEDRGPWRRAGKIAVTNTRTGQVLPLYPDVLDDIDQHGAALDILAAARRIQVPWLLIHGAEDESVRLSEAELLRSASPAERSRLLTVAGAGHTFGAVHPWQSSTPELDLVFDATLDWLTDQLK